MLFYSNRTEKRSSTVAHFMDFLKVRQCVKCVIDFQLIKCERKCNYLHLLRYVIKRVCNLLFLIKYIFLLKY